MRIWSIHPKYLDSKGLIALWRETLLAKHVLEKRTKGYKNHPQLNRFKEAQNPLDSIHVYLQEVFFESKKRKYNFSSEKLDFDAKVKKIPVNDGQIQYEWIHLGKKLQKRDPERQNEQKNIMHPESHPLFEVQKGEIESWEVV